MKKVVSPGLVQLDIILLSPFDKDNTWHGNTYKQVEMFSYPRDICILQDTFSSGGHL